MPTTPVGWSATISKGMASMCGSDRTAMGRSDGDDWLVRRGVVAAEPAAREEGWGVLGSQVTRLHGTP